MNAAVVVLVVVVHHYTDFSIPFNKILMFVCQALSKCFLKFYQILSFNRYSLLAFIFFFFFWLCWVSVAARGLSLVAASWGYSLLQ